MKGLGNKIEKMDKAVRFTITAMSIWVSILMTNVQVEVKCSIRVKCKSMMEIGAETGDKVKETS